MNEFKIKHIENKTIRFINIEELSDIENQVLGVINLKLSSLDEIIYSSNIERNIVINTLFLLELKGIVRMVGQYYRIQIQKDV